MKYQLDKSSLRKDLGPARRYNYDNCIAMFHLGVVSTDVRDKHKKQTDNCKQHEIFNNGVYENMVQKYEKVEDKLADNSMR